MVVRKIASRQKPLSKGEGESEYIAKAIVYFVPDAKGCRWCVEVRKIWCFVHIHASKRCRAFFKYMC